jgi:hypothetical protein
MQNEKICMTFAWLRANSMMADFASLPPTQLLLHARAAFFAP